MMMAVFTRIHVLLFLYSCWFAVAVANECSLSYSQKFGPECSGLNISFPPVIFQDQPFLVTFLNDNVFIANVSLYNSSDEYCGPDTFSQGHQCIISTQGGSNATIVCPESLSIAAGPVSLIIGLTNCAIDLNMTWGQITELSVVQFDSGLELDVVNNIYVVRNFSNSFNITCSVLPATGPPPTLAITPIGDEAVVMSLYQEANVIVASFPNGITTEYSALYTCSSAHNVSAILYLVTSEDIPSVFYPNGDSIEVIVGSSLNITAVLLTDQSINSTTVQFIPVNASDDGDLLSPLIQTWDDQVYYITYTAVGLNDVGLYNVCFTYSLDSSDNAMMMSSGFDVYDLEICIGTFNLTVSVPSVIASTNLLVHRAAVYESGLVSVSCTPSDPNAIIRWQFLDSVPLWEVYPSYQFYPSGLNHTVVVTSAPVGIVLVECGLYDPGELQLVNEQRITLVTVSRPVSMWNNNQELLPNSIINSFRTFYPDNVPFLSLRCFSESGYGNLQWQTQGVVSLPDTLTQELVNSTEALTVVGNDRDLTLNYANFSSDDTGYYICSSGERGENVSIFTTLSDPFWNFSGPSYIEAPIGTNVSFMAQYAYGSEGYGNTGAGITFSVRATPDNSELPAYFILENALLNDTLYSYNYSFALSTSDSAMFTFQASQNNTIFSSEVVKVQAIVPIFDSIIMPVYALLGRRVNMSCFPNDTTAPVNWGIWNYEMYVPINDKPAFDLSPIGLDHVIEFNLTSATFSTPQYSYDVDSGSVSIIQFRCGFRNGSSQQSFISRSDVMLRIQQEVIALRYGFNFILNNSIVNSFNNEIESRKRAIANGELFSVTCTAVQGDEYPLFKAELFSNPGVISVIGSSRESNPYLTSTGVHQTTLNANVRQNISGRYFCESSVTGVFKTFIIAAENPFVRVQSNRTVNAFLGDNITLSFIAAMDSTGRYNGVSRLPALFVSQNGSSNNSFFISQSCESEGDVCYEYRYSINFVRPQHAGQYTGRLLDEECDLPNCYVSDTINVSVEVPQLVPSRSSVQVIVGSTLSLQCLPTQGNFIISWALNGTTLYGGSCPARKRNVQLSSCFYPLPYRYNLYLSHVSFSDAGLYTCSLVVADQVVISQTISVTVIEVPPVYLCFSSLDCTGRSIATVDSTDRCCTVNRGVAYKQVQNNEELSVCAQCSSSCPRNFSNGILWNETAANTLVTVPCTVAGNQFRSGLLASRRCSESAQWEQVDLTNCLLLEGSTDSATIWVALNTDDIDLVQSNRTVLEGTLGNLLTNLNISYMSLNFESAYLDSQSVLVEFHVELSTVNESSTEEIVLSVSNSLSSLQQFGGIPTLAISSGIQVFVASTSCPCQSTTGRSGGVTVLCVGGASTPCNCINGTCQCVSPFVGDGVLCTLDSDGDLYPDEPLVSCSEDNTVSYCVQDNCVSIFNPNQDLAACQVLQNFEGCGFGVDTTWGVAWANTLVGAVDRQPCPGKAATLGTATRKCLLRGVWGEPVVLNCIPIEYQNYLNQVDSILASNASTEEQLVLLRGLISDLAASTSQTVQSRELFLPGSLNATNRIVEDVIDLLYVSLENASNVSEIAIDLSIVDVVSDLLDSNQISGWQQLQRSNSNNTRGSDVLLENAERFGVYLALTRNRTLSRRQNIVVSTKQYTVTDDSPLTLPQPDELVDTPFANRKANVSIPPELLRQRKTEGDSFVPVVSILFQNLEDFLQDVIRNSSNTTRPGSLMWSGQVSQMTGRTESPINITFAVDNITNVSSYRCVYWNTESRDWADDGVETLQNTVDENGVIRVNCQSFHLTAFAVLVDVSGTIRETSPAEYTALKVVSYIGCAVSIVCLFITIVFFIIQGKTLLKSVHFFVHLNLAIALFCGYFIFSVGVETARSSRGGCAFVAALLHYFFLSSFCWMMCEGIMLYLMLVMVFSTLSKRWYFFMILGWVPPILPVIIGLAAGHRYYGVENNEGDLLYCWLSVENGVIWSFVAPMLIIILINTVFLILALVSIWRSRSRQHKIRHKKGKHHELALSLLKASLVLLPLLGLTWVFGLLTVNRNTTAFAWLFTLLNSVQGVAIFFFHVVRSDKVWTRVSSGLTRIKSRATLKSQSYELSSTQSTLSKKQQSNPSIKMEDISFKKSATENDYSSPAGLGFSNVAALTADEEEEHKKELSHESKESTADRIEAKEKEALQNEEDKIEDLSCV